MTEQECLTRMIMPSQKREGVPYGGIIQIHITRMCDRACFNCTQGSNLRGPYSAMSLENFEIAVKSLVDYFGVVGIFGGNPCLHPQFHAICYILQKYIPKERCGLWSNRIFNYGSVCRETFNPLVSNLNVHMNVLAFEEIITSWPEARPFGLVDDSRHAPVYVSMIDLGIEESRRWELISRCDINQRWSAMICEIRGKLRGFFCEIAGAMSMLHQWDRDHNDDNSDCPYALDKTNYSYSDCTCFSWPDTGVEITEGWWKLSSDKFLPQIRQNCHHCGVPLRGYGSLAVSDKNAKQHISKTHTTLPSLKGQSRRDINKRVQIVSREEELCSKNLPVVEYIQGAKK